MSNPQYSQQPLNSMYNAVQVNAPNNVPSEENGFFFAPSNSLAKTNKAVNPTTDDRNLSFTGPSYILSIEDQLMKKKNDPVKKHWNSRYTNFSGMS